MPTHCCDFSSSFSGAFSVDFAAMQNKTGVIHWCPLHCLVQIRRTIAAPHIKKDFAGLLAGAEGDRKKVAQLADLLERMMALDPDKRITPKDALKHPFIKEPKA